MEEGLSDVTVAQARRVMSELDLPFIQRVTGEARRSQVLLTALAAQYLGDGELTREEAEQLAGYVLLLAAIRREAAGLAEVTELASTAVVSVAHREGVAVALPLIEVARPAGVTGPVVSLRRPGLDAGSMLVEAQLRHQLLRQYGDDAVRMWEVFFQRNLEAGMPVPVAAREAVTLLIGPSPAKPGWLLWRSMITIRKTNYDQFRGAMIETYRLNLWDGAAWRWRSRLDRRVCAACLALHGRVFRLEEDFDRAHIGCRCLPEIVGGFGSGGLSGEEWLRSEPVEVQNWVLGLGGGELFRRRRVALEDFLKLERHPVHGETWRSGGVKWAERRALRRTLAEANVS